MTSILITSGGTKVPIDPVRHISNISSGRFGAALAGAALKASMQVTYLTAEHAYSPFTCSTNFYTHPDWQSQLSEWQVVYEFYQKYRSSYEEHRYNSFTEYHEQLKNLVLTRKPRIIMLAAAVSDYLVENYSGNKIRSNEQLQVNLKPAPKIIQEVRAWAPASLLVGFKLLVNASDDELISAAKINIERHDLDFCVANDLSTVQRHAHEVILVKRDGVYQKIKQQLAATIINECIQAVT